MMTIIYLTGPSTSKLFNEIYLHPFSVFTIENTRLLQENQFHDIRFDSQTHHSTILSGPKALQGGGHLGRNP